ncbi:OsmC family protein [Halarchaeum salinum]|uniref:OsmC family protein n=1 Tax=Halarchaeum salinum TaxID=489912 RepID=A0AAV3S9U6_9EURY
MADLETTTISNEGHVASSRLGDFRLTTDADDDAGPNPSAVLLADYAACYASALRVTAADTDYDDLGEVRIEAEADREDGELTAIRFDVAIAAALDAADATDLVEAALAESHIGAALREELRADVSVETDAR